MLIETFHPSIYLAMFPYLFIASFPVLYIQRELSRNHEDIEFEIVPGVTSMFAFAARAKMSLATI
jgi:precorrin-2 methylase